MHGISTMAVRRTDLGAGGIGGMEGGGTSNNNNNNNDGLSTTKETLALVFLDYVNCESLLCVLYGYTLLP